MESDVPIRRMFSGGEIGEKAHSAEKVDGF